jgi:hypothetical protein
MGRLNSYLLIKMAIDIVLPKVNSYKYTTTFHLYLVKESVNVRITTEIIYSSRFQFIGLHKRQ